MSEQQIEITRTDKGGVYFRILCDGTLSKEDICATIKKAMSCCKYLKQELEDEKEGY